MSGVSMVIHPHTGDRFVDHFGQPINVGDQIVYPVVYGSSGAELAHAVIDRIVPLVEVPGDWWSVAPHVRVDQQHKKYPTEYYPKFFTPGKVDYKYAYVLSVKLADNGRPSTVKNVWNVIKEPS